MNIGNLVFEIEDEFGINRKVRGLISLTIENNNYLVYSMDINDNKCEILVSKIIKFNKKTRLIDISDNEERHNVFKIVNTLLIMSDNKELSKYLKKNKTYLGK